MTHDSRLVFTHLHTHSWFSFGQGPSSPEALVEAAWRRGFDTLALTDTNGVYGAIEFQRACKAADIRPILGAHLVTGRGEAVVLAKDPTGWASLCEAVTAIHWHPNLDLASQLAHHREGLVVLSQDVALLERVVRESGPKELHAELRPGPQRHAVLAAARRLGLPPVATGGVMMARKHDWSRHRLLRAIHRNLTLSQVDDAWPRDRRLQSALGLARHFPDVPEALTNTLAIAERCRHTIPIGREPIAPRASRADESLRKLEAMARDGAVRRYGVIDRVIEDRLREELDIIAEKKFADYFLVVHEIVHRDGVVHCGRGSVANSLVSYCLDITHVDPLAAKLIFARFLNRARKDPPDIDLDFPWDERDRIFQWVFEKHRHFRAAMVANHNTLRLAGALREVAKVHGRPPAEIREVTRRIPYFAEGSPSELIATHPNFRDLRLPKVWETLAATAETLVGTPRHLSLHPGGVVIVPTTLTEHVPVEPAAKVLDCAPSLPVPVIQFEKDGAEDAGLVKIDLLGNRSLAVIRDAIAMVRTGEGTIIDPTSSTAGDDPATQDCFAAGDTMGVFYTESPASRLLNHKSRAKTFDLLVLNTSIIRPASNKFINIYLRRLHGEEAVVPLHESLTETLRDTYGVMVYQEDVVNVAHDFAGFSWDYADGLRKALSKKRPEKHLPAYYREFIDGARALGRDEETIRKVWDMTLSFTGYSFCKGHSCSYIQVAQQSAYLRANHPAEFIAAVLSNEGGFYRAFAYVAEARRMGVEIRSPDVNASAWRCTATRGALRVGFQFVKGFSADAAARLLAARAERPFGDLQDLRRRSGLSPEHLRLLIKVGACDSLDGGLNRPQLLWLLDTTDPARADAAFVAERHPVPPLRDYDPVRKREDAWALLGFCLDAHPMTLHENDLARFRLVSSTDLHRHVGRRVLMAGMYTTGKPVHTAKDEPMQFATFDDGHGLVECVLFPDVYRERAHVLFDQGPFLWRGVVEEEFGVQTVTVTHLERLQRVLGRMPHAAHNVRPGSSVSSG